MLITTVTADREMLFENPAHAREAIETLYRVQQLHPFFLYGFVIMPDHAHFLIFVPSPQTISKIMNVYKMGVAFNTGLRGMWQRRFDARIIKNKDTRTVLNYIHANPVKKGIVEKSEDYRWSSACGQWDVSQLHVQ